MHNRVGKKWEAVLQQLRTEIPEEQYNRWISSLELREFTLSNVEIAAPNSWTREHVERNYRPQIESAIQSVARRPVALTINVAETLSRKEEKRIEPSPEDAAFVEQLAGTQKLPPSRWSELRLNPKHNFENFVVGNCNRFAHHAAEAVAADPGKTIYNPFFLYAGVGLGKTHLLQAICHRICQNNPNAKIAYLSCEGLINYYLKAVQHRSLGNFRERFREVDVLAIDDVHFLESKTEYLQEEFFHTFNFIQDSEHQMVISSDRPPNEIQSVHKRLTSRFGAGLVSALEKPDYDTRLSILHHKLSLLDKPLPEDVLAFVANRITSNIRELEGALVKLVGFSTLMKQEITLEVAHEVLKDVLEEVPVPIRINDIQNFVSDHFNVKASELQSKKRSKSIVFPRQICMFLARRLTDQSLEEIGYYFGGRDHTTVLYGVDKIRKLAKTDTNIAALLNDLTKKLMKRP